MIGKKRVIIILVNSKKYLFYTLEEQKIDGDRAQIEYRVITPDIKTSVKFYFKKVDDKWFLEFIN